MPGPFLGDASDPHGRIQHEGQPGFRRDFDALPLQDHLGSGPGGAGRPNSMRAISVMSRVWTSSPTSTLTWRDVPPRYVPSITRPLLSVMVSAKPNMATARTLSLIHISEPTRRTPISY